MPKQVSSKFKIFKIRGLDSDLDESWVDWAIEMIEAGYTSSNLYELAGITRPYDQVYLRHLTDKIFIDLGLEFTDKETAKRNYVSYIISKNLDNPNNYLETLLELKNIYLDSNYEKGYGDFYLLYFAKYDLTNYEDQFYWIGADRENIDNIIKEQFQNFIDKLT
jgi:hypothetical protein